MSLSAQRKVLQQGSEEIKSLEHLKVFVERVIPSFSDRQLILLDGPMGVGKTQWVKTLNECLGLEEASSPTYALHHSYKSEKQNIFIDHLDLYRIENAEELESIAFWDLFEKQKGWIVVEWPEKVSVNEWPLDWPTFHFKLSIKEEDSSLRSIDWFSYQ